MSNRKFLLLILTLLIVLVSCVREVSEVRDYYVRFYLDYKYGESFEQVVKKNEHINLNYVEDKVEETAKEKKYYIFKGWFLDKDFKQKWDFSNDVVTKNIKLYAKWEREIAVVSFTIDNGSSIYHTETVNKGEEIENLYYIELPTKEYYNFTGWYYFYNGDFIQWPYWNIVEDDITLYAKWRKVRASVNFNSNGGSLLNTIYPEMGDKIIKPNDPTKNLYRFIAWYKDETFLEEWDFDTDTVEESSIRLYAKWEKQCVVVEFESNGGSNVEAVVVDKNSLVPKPDDPSKYFHRLDAWYKDETLLEEWDFDTDTVEESNITLYAKWIEQSRVCFNDTFTNYYDDVFVDLGSTVSEPDEPESEYATFAGWYKDGNFLEEWNFDTDIVTKSITSLYLKWDIHKDDNFTIVPRKYLEMFSYYYIKDINYIKVTELTQNDFGDYSIITGLLRKEKNKSFHLKLKSDEVVNYTSDFDGMDNLISIDLSECNYLNQIYYGVFINCKNLTSVNLSNCNNLTQLPESAFENCKNLTSIILPNNITGIGWNVFEGTGLESIDLSNCNSLEVIGICGWKNLRSIILPNNIREVWHAFEGTELESIDLSNCSKLIEIGDSAFKDCKNLTSIIFPNSITKIGESAFEGSGIEGIDLSNCSELTEIGNGAFKDCENLTSVDLSNCSELTEIGNGAFKDCENLTSVDLSNCSKLIEIGDSAFKDCKNLTSIIFPNSITRIGRYAFEETGLESIDLSNCSELTELEDDVFENCEDLSSINLPNSITKIGSGAFVGTSLDTIDLSNCSELTEIGGCVFYNCKSLRSIDLPNSITIIGDWAFEKTGLKSIDLSNCSQLGVIGYCAFSDCQDLAEVKLPDSINQIYDKAFNNGCQKVLVPNSNIWHLVRNSGYTGVIQYY